MMTYEQALGYVNGYTKSGEPMKDLVRFVILMRLLGNPHTSFKSVHIQAPTAKEAPANISAIRLCRRVKLWENSLPLI